MTLKIIQQSFALLVFALLLFAYLREWYNSNHLIKVALKLLNSLKNHRKMVRNRVRDIARTGYMVVGGYTAGVATNPQLFGLTSFVTVTTIMVVAMALSCFVDLMEGERKCGE